MTEQRVPVKVVNAYMKADPAALAAVAANIPPAVHFETEQVQEKPVLDSNNPDAKGNKYGFEGGCVVKLNGIYHLFVAEMVGDPLWEKMRLAHWTSNDAIHWKRVATLRETSGVPATDQKMGLPYNSVWDPYPIFNEIENRWELFYVTYLPSNTVGKIRRAVSAVLGKKGIDGPYHDVGIILQPDSESQKWEGQQGTDSFYPYQVGRKWYALYGSHAASWNVGVAEAPALGGPWKRRLKGNPLPIEPVFMENPVIIHTNGLYVAVYDCDVINPVEIRYYQESHSVGYSTSRDGVHWSAGGRVTVQPDGPAHWSRDIRTPLGLVDEGKGEYTLLYTAEKPSLFWPVGMVKLKMVKN